MSCALTTPQVELRIKTVTRRIGWGFLKAGDMIQLVEKCQGLKKGQKVRKLAVVKIVSTGWEPLDAITQEECDKEGFSEMSPSQFIKMFMAHNRCERGTPVNRIEWTYTGEDAIHLLDLIRSGNSPVGIDLEMMFASANYPFHQEDGGEYSNCTICEGGVLCTAAAACTADELGAALRIEAKTAALWIIDNKITTDAQGIRELVEAYNANTGDQKGRS